MVSSKGDGLNFTYSSKDGLDIFAGVRGRDEVRAKLKLPCKVFAKTAFSESSTDVFGDVLMKSWYDQHDSLSGVQLYYPEASLDFKGQALLGVSVDLLEQFLQRIHANYEFEDDGSGLKLLTDGLEIGLYVPDLENGKSAIVEAVYIPVPAQV
ncbi:hypothetical protein N5C37_21645 [Pseudomonas mosselii]|uniref:hypothetical protein n=1 Tax=Pseudomonas mosselii TaxID=78327 RepID=UPI0021A43FB0|nr:hypothetical protein [Pseudomonas mosselii]MDH1103712.1 hypothetical protein [Pseudomonas mosselii]MEA3236210.1 hypothetical protein [Pseudomonas mosselii]UWS68625.1 hypothetical protein N0U38_07490 [Pseudomonas mosselii]